MSEKHNSVIAAVGIDIGKNLFYVVGLSSPTARQGEFRRH